MPFKDPDVQRRYYREMMRNRRARAREREPDHAAIKADIARWMSREPWRRPAWVHKVLDAIAGLDLRTEEGAKESARIYLAARAEHRATVQAKREDEARREAEWKADYERRYGPCNWCGELPSHERVVIGHGDYRICEPCARLVIERCEAERAKRQAGTESPAPVD
jgi:hypothetical protein